jgi:hypothetical protein
MRQQHAHTWLNKEMAGYRGTPAGRSLNATPSAVPSCQMLRVPASRFSSSLITSPDRSRLPNPVDTFLPLCHKAIVPIQPHEKSSLPCPSNHESAIREGIFQVEAPTTDCSRSWDGDKHACNAPKRAAMQAQGAGYARMVGHPWGGGVQRTRYCALDPAVITPKKMFPLGVVLSTRTSLQNADKASGTNATKGARS